MTLGDTALFSGESYLGIGRETTFGTYATATAALDFISSSIKVTKENKILQQIERKRTMAKSLGLGKMVEGDLEFYPSPDVTATAYIFQNAFGGAEITNATAAGEAAGGSATTHSIETGSFGATFSSLSINQRKGDATNGKVWEYHGGRVNTLGLSAEIDEPLKASASIIFQDETQLSNDIETALTVAAYEVMSFVNGRFSVESTFASMTASSFWEVQNINFSLNNNLKNDASARRIGSDVLSTLPIGVQSYDLSVQVRFNTTTAYDAMLAQTEYAAEFEFLGTTITGGSSTTPRGINLMFPKVVIKDAGDPEISGPDNSLVSTISFNVLRDDSSASGYAVKAEITSDIDSF